MGVCGDCMRHVGSGFPVIVAAQRCWVAATGTGAVHAAASSPSCSCRPRYPQRIQHRAEKKLFLDQVGAWGTGAAAAAAAAGAAELDSAASRVCTEKRGWPTGHGAVPGACNAFTH